MIRKAISCDADAIAQVHVQSWLETYQGIVKKSILEQQSVSERTHLWQQVLRLPQHHVWVFEDHRGIWGFIDLELLEQQGFAEIRALYLLKEVQGQGIGCQLMQHAFSCCAEYMIHRIQLDVFDQNSSCGFYERLGAQRYAEESADDFALGLKTIYYQWFI